MALKTIVQKNKPNILHQVIDNIEGRIIARRYSASFKRNNQTGSRPSKQRIESGVRSSRYLYGNHIFRIAPCFVLIECKRLYVTTESMKSYRIRLEILKKNK